MRDDSKPSRVPLPLALVACLAVLASTLVVYRPDRPVATIAPGSSAGPAFVVQIIRPRSGLPLGGLLPPQLFGLESRLGFDSASPGAAVRSVGPRRLELVADGWELVLVADADGAPATETQVIFEFLFEERPRRVRCRIGEPAVGTLRLSAAGDSAELSGSFDIELPHCEDADTGQVLDWPPRPLVLHGSLDRIPLDFAPRSR